ncbi:hypothetical protein BDW75DRAFT_226192 [Aspergillus navahoensis]
MPWPAVFKYFSHLEPDILIEWNIKDEPQKAKVRGTDGIERDVELKKKMLVKPFVMVVYSYDYIRQWRLPVKDTTFGGVLRALRKCYKWHEGTTNDGYDGGEYDDGEIGDDEYDEYEVADERIDLFLSQLERSIAQKETIGRGWYVRPTNVQMDLSKT